ncbi:bifunctional hydroxymethylpyrimidine kinase/phosphomethylpyrimidine kinase [Streptomyces sp. P38-E01]|uniref:Bifunctional hydroxymethylpyrimidine kinase/phosphomethylpyrimidine kinase n=1 Tax=Streptomyces tardus TaxID=2780544 RepID=A0A949N7G4_9ACTN|nr:bifunctional hydroxymethylpyrimidine kinase/phosphomethylpyrimidine kinase [Streptomyces tardus]MBU7600097.1 bifunctional hydroxymethylpyrimidine kinase/phosphomethylpyrimidine kinase [Streptomyces tardus]
MSGTPTGPRVRCLTIGSSDSGGGAGIQGDLKAFARAGVYGSSALVGVTAQNTTGVTATASIDTDMVGHQLRAVLEDIGTDAVKIGTTWSAELVWLLVDRLVWLDEVPVVLDPVMISAAGSALGGEEDAVTAVREGLLPLTWVATPNPAEARRLTRLEEESDPRKLAEAIVELGARAAIITDAFPTGAGDLLFDGERHHEITGPRRVSGCDHGAGCAHSALITAFLAQGMPLTRAARTAHAAVSLAIERGAADIGAGRHPVELHPVGPTTEGPPW